MVFRWKSSLFLLCFARANAFCPPPLRPEKLKKQYVFTEKQNQIFYAWNSVLWTRSVPMKYASVAAATAGDISSARVSVAAICAADEHFWAHFNFRLIEMTDENHGPHERIFTEAGAGGTIFSRQSDALIRYAKHVMCNMSRCCCQLPRLVRSAGCRRRCSALRPAPVTDI